MYSAENEFLFTSFKQKVLFRIQRAYDLVFSIFMKKTISGKGTPLKVLFFTKEWHIAENELVAGLEAAGEGVPDHVAGHAAFST